MHSFLNTVISLSPVLLVIMPVAGACFGWGISQLGMEFNRWTAFSNSLISCLILATLLTAPALKDESPTRAISITLKLPADEVSHGRRETPRHFQWAIDRVSLWFLLLPFALWPALILLSRRIGVESRGHYFLLMLLQALLAGLFVSYDLISFVSFLLASTFCMLCLIRIWSGSRSIRLLESTMFLQFLGDAFIVTGLLLAATGYTWMQGLLLESPQPVTFQFNDILQGTVDDVALYPLAETYWSTISPWIFLVLITGFTIKGAIFPAHYGMTQWMRQESDSALFEKDRSTWCLVLLALFTKISIYGMLRFMVPLNQSVVQSISAEISFWGMCGFLYFSLLACRGGLVQSIVSFLLGQTALTLTLLFAAEPAAVANLIIYNVIQGLACCLLLLVVPVLSVTVTGKSSRLLVWIAGFVILSLAGLPGLGGFAVQFVLLWNLLQDSLLVALFYLAGSLLFQLALIRGFWQLLKTAAETKAQPEDDTNYEQEHRLFAWLAFGPVLLLILVTGISPASLAEKNLLPLFPVRITEIETPDAEN
ncbi:proton-conducting transporter membrane subunit [Gimesia sp.]|uniref:proton-conducting transporter transmembrane domain-containing protein n=1 Tax=Gimesia sp. TaxID=2024833 RepID=UPI003A93FB62